MYIYINKYICACACARACIGLTRACVCSDGAVYEAEPRLHTKIAPPWQACVCGVALGPRFGLTRRSEMVAHIQKRSTKEVYKGYRKHDRFPL